jgi:hypothetical protein
MTALFPSLRACALAYFPGNNNLTAVCISREVIVDFALECANLDASAAILSSTSLTKLFIMLITLLEISGCTCFNTL